MQAPAQPTALPAFLSVEAAAALAIAALIAAAIALAGGRSLTRRLLLAIEGERFHTQPIANATVRAVRRVTFVLSAAGARPSPLSISPASS